MVNEQLVNWIKDNLARGYDLNSLRNQLLQGGHSQVDVDEAINYKPNIPPLKKVGGELLENAKKSEISGTQEVSTSNGVQSKDEKGKKRKKLMLWIGGAIGIILLILLLFLLFAQKELPLTTPVAVAEPAPVEPEIQKRVQRDISLGGDFTCLLLENGNVTCWGYENQFVTDIYTGGNAVAISSGSGHGCVLLDNGDVACRVVDKTVGELVLKRYSFGNAIKVAAGHGYTCALLDNGNIDCWWIKDPTSDKGQTEGYNGGNAMGVSSGPAHACALLNNGNVVCWGFWADSDPKPDGYTGGDAIGVSVGAGNGCALLNNGNINCWGNELWGDGRVKGYTGGNAIGVSSRFDYT